MAKFQKIYEDDIVITEHSTHITHWSRCGKCGLPVSTRVAWYDPYNNKMYLTKGAKGCYVHFDCLSKKRMNEVVIKNQ